MLVGLIGATGYTGLELLRLLAQHPRRPEVSVVTSRREAGRALTDVFPSLAGLANYDRLVFEDPAGLAGRAEVFFLAAPHGAAQALAPALLDGGAKVIDLSADFRLKDPAVFEQWYRQSHAAPGLLGQAVYGLPEINGPALARARLVANPGCYPTSAILGLAPLLKAGLPDPDWPIIVDAASGVTGAGRGALPGVSFCEVSESFKAYKVVGHRHTPEMEQELAVLGGRPLTVAFTPHLAPLNRGILATIYIRPRGDIPSTEELRSLYLDFYGAAPFVRVRPPGFEPRTLEVRGTNFCDLSLFPDPRSGLVKVIVALDNLCRGASGQALANFNLINGWAETEGLMAAPLTP